MVAKNGGASVLNLADALELYYDLLEQSKAMDQHVRMLRDRILRTMSARRIDQVEADGFEAVRQLRHHPPHLNEERAVDILRRHGRLEECQVETLDQDRAREVIEELFRHGALSKDELPFAYVRPTEALVVRRVEALPMAAREVPEVRRVA